MGTGEVTRYLGGYGSERVRKAVLFAPIPPFLLKTADNLDGVDQGIPGLLEDVRLIEVAGGPHNIGWTHPEEVNKALLDFLSD